MSNARRPISYLATSKPEEAAVFYSHVMGCKLIDKSPYALAFMDGDQMLRVQIIDGFSPPSYTVHGWRVSNIEKEVRALAALGVSFEV